MSTIPGFPDATSPTPETGLLWLTEGSGSTRDKKVQAGALVADLLGRAVNSQAAAATPIVGATDLIPVARGNTGGKASVDAVVSAGFAGGFPAAVAALDAASAFTGTETLPILQTTAKEALVSRLFPGVVEFTSLQDVFPGAVATLEASIKSQYRMTVHKAATGEVPLYADLGFHWSATFADSGSCGWTIGDDAAALGTGLDSALRTLWGIAPGDDWPFPYLHGNLRVGVSQYNVQIWNEGGGASGSRYAITAWTATEEARLYPFGDLSFRIPGRALPV